MAVPKKKPSKTRQRHRHSAWRAEFKLDQLVKCKSCEEMKTPHRVCPHCGKYSGVQVVEPETTIRKVKGD